MLVQDLLIEAMSLVGAISIDEVPTSPELNSCLRSANMMLDSWSAQRLMIRAVTREPFPLTGGVYSYQIGTGATFNTGKPIEINSAFIRDANGYDTPLEIIEQDQYDGYTDKTVASGRPLALCYNPGKSQQATQAGTIFIYYIPDTSYTLFIENQKYLTEFVNLTDVVSFEPAYFEAIAYNLAGRIWPKFHQSGTPVPAEVAGIARTSKRTIENMNSRPAIMGTDLPGSKVSNFNIYTGE